MTDQAARFVGSIPEHYDRGLGPRIFTGFANDIARRLVKNRPASTLELAAGTGIVTRSLRDALPDDCGILATDLNPPMLEWARRKFPAEEKVRFESADATALPYAEASFDAVVCQFGVMFFPDKEQSYAEAFRVLKSGGRYLFNVWGSLDRNPFASITHEVVAGFFPDDPPGFYKVPFSYHDLEQIRDSLSGAGFSQVAIEQLELGSTIPSASEFATGLVYGNPLFDEILARDGNPEEVHAAVAAALDRELGDSMQLSAIVIDAFKD